MSLINQREKQMPTFQKIEYIPTQVLTMRIRNIMKAKEILLQGD
ncbi:hypothetical protein [Peribacillus butanolivorans]|nr:hypothetical protein [Peribacillus butanolivorans]